VIKKLHATFDGEVFLPRELIDIKPGTEWVIVISNENGQMPVGEMAVSEELHPEKLHPLEAVIRLSTDIRSSTDIGPADLSENEEELHPPENQGKLHPLEAITRLSTDMGPADLSESFDHYIRILGNISE
jgi:hypothetical protein